MRFRIVPFCCVLAFLCILLLSTVAFNASATARVFLAVRGEIHLGLAKWYGGMPPSPPLTRGGFLRIAHAAGEVSGKRYRNAREGLDLYYDRGCRFFEMDFNWTADGILVSTHDWNSFFDDPLTHIPTTPEFISRQRRDGLTQMTFDDVALWLGTHRDAYLITDVKERTRDALAYIALSSVRR